MEKIFWFFFSKKNILPPAAKIFRFPLGAPLNVI